MICPTCERDCPEKYMSKHHLRTRRADKHLKEPMCRDCHTFVHRLFTNKELADPELKLDTVEGLLANEEYAKAVKFIRKLPPGRRVRIAQSRKRKRKQGKSRR